MQSNPNPMEMPEQMDEAEIDAAVEAALAKSGTDQVHASHVTADREAAALEERLAFERIQAAKAMSEAAGQPSKPQPVEEPEEDLATVASKGREYLMRKLREHNEKIANRPVAPPPQMSEKMRTRIAEELEAGKRTQAKHQAMKDSRPVGAAVPNALERAAAGTNTPVFRPGNMVTDPHAPPGREGLAPMRQ